MKNMFSIQIVTIRTRTEINRITCWGKNYSWLNYLRKKTSPKQLKQHVKSWIHRDLIIFPLNFSPYRSSPDSDKLSWFCWNFAPLGQVLLLYAVKNDQKQSMYCHCVPVSGKLDMLHLRVKKNPHTQCTHTRSRNFKHQLSTQTTRFGTCVFLAMYTLTRQVCWKSIIQSFNSQLCIGNLHEKHILH